MHLNLIADTVNTVIIGKGLMIAGGFIGAPIGIGLIGSGYIQAVGRNPEADKFFGKLFIFVGMAEFFGLLGLGATFFIK